MPVRVSHTRFFIHALPKQSERQPNRSNFTAIFIITTCNTTISEGSVFFLRLTSPIVTSITPMSTDIRPMLVSITPMSADIQPMLVSIPPMSADIHPMLVSIPPMSADIQPMLVSILPMSADIHPMLVSIPPMSADIQPMLVNIHPMLVSTPAMSVDIMPVIDYFTAFSTFHTTLLLIMNFLLSGTFNERSLQKKIIINQLKKLYNEN